MNFNIDKETLLNIPCNSMKKNKKIPSLKKSFRKALNIKLEKIQFNCEPYLFCSDNPV